jgi:preprotein translocase subunit SecE
MAKPAKKTRRIKPVETVRERAAKGSETPKPRRLRQTVSSASKPFKAAGRAGKREYHVPLPDNRFGRLLSKRVRFIPKFFREAWAEVKQVTWPSRRETLKLALAVFIFALVFGGLIWVVDYGLENLFRKVLLQ